MLTAPRIATMLFAVFVVLTPVTWANEFFIPLDLPKPNFIGLGIGAYPDYLGSDDDALGAAPLGRIQLGGERYLQVIATDFRLNLLDHPNWRLGPIAFWRFGREDVDDRVVDRLSEVGDSIDLGLFGGYSWRDPQEIRKQAGISAWALWDASDEYEGWTAGANATAMWPVARPVTVAGGVGTTYASEGYMETYFGVTSMDSLASGLPAFSAEAGLRDARGWLMGILHLSPQWHIGAGVLYSRLLSDAADSPIVSERGSKDQWVYGVGALYAW